MVTLLSAVPAHAAGIEVDDYKPDLWYTAVSTTGDCIEFPREKEYLSTPYVAKVYAIQRQISIYLMPQPEKGHGNLGIVGHGKMTDHSPAGLEEFTHTWDGSIRLREHRRLSDRKTL